MSDEMVTVPVVMTLRQHIKAHHPRIRPARANADLVRQHMREHHQLITSHNHGPTRAGSGAKDRPVGWTTGEDVRMIRPGGQR